MGEAQIRRRSWAQWLFWSAAAFTLVMALLPHPPELLGQGSDKVQHMIAFAVLAALARLAFAKAPWLGILVGLSLFGAVIEALQAIPELHRDSDRYDWIADTIAAATVLAMAAAAHLFSRR